MTQELVLIFDFGSQFGQLIARRVREQNVFCQVVRHDLSAERVRELNPKGIIFAFVIVPYLRDGRVVEALPYLAALTAIISAVALCWISAGTLLRVQLRLAPDGALIRRTGAIVLGVFSVFVTTAAFRT